MLTGKRILAIAVFALLHSPLPAAEPVGEAERKASAQNPALPSQDDLVSFDNTTPVRQIVVTEIGANQKAFPRFYGALPATTGTLAAAPAQPGSPQTGLRPNPGENGIVETGHPIHLQGGGIARTYRSVPVPEASADPSRQHTGSPAQPSGIDESQPLLASSQASGPDTLSTPDSLTAQPAAPIAAATAKVAVSPSEPAPPMAAITAPPDGDEPLHTASVKSDPASAALEKAAPATTLRPQAKGPAQPDTEFASAAASVTPGDPVSPPKPAAKAASAADTAMPPAPEATGPASLAAVPSNGSPLFPGDPSAFPMTSITPPPIPSSASQFGDADPQHPATVGLAEFRAGRALDGTPLPPPPPMPELPARQKEKETVADKPDPAQVRADFNRLKSFCEEDSLGSAAEIYARMPDFGDNEEINRLRADAANLLILGLARNDNLRAARRIFNSVPAKITGQDANLAKTRGIINLATYYVRAERFNDAFDIIVELEEIEDRSALNNELFRLLARMIPYLDNADETEKASKVYDILLAEVKSPTTASLFSNNIQGVLKYYFHYVDKSENPLARRKRMDFLEHIYSSLDRLKSNPEIRLVRGTVGVALADRYAGDPDRAALFLEE